MVYDVKNFQTEVIEKSRQIPVLVDFWAEWCGPCRILGPILERLAEQNEGSWVLAKLNTEEHQETAIKYGIRSIPNVKLFIDGEAVDEFTGALPEHMIEDWLKKAIPSKNKAKIDEAKKLISENKLAEGQKLLEELLKVEPSNEEIKILLAKVLLFNDPKRAAELAENADESPEYFELAEAIRTIANLLARKKDSLSEHKVKDLYFSAVEDMKNQNFDAALEKFIEVIRVDRTFDDDGARKACIAVFKYLGEEHEITRKHRRNFGSALYV